MNRPLFNRYLQPKRVHYPPLDHWKHISPEKKKKNIGDWLRHKRRYNRARIIVDSNGNLQNVLSMGCASHSESEMSNDPDTTTYKRQVFKRVITEKDKNIIGTPAIKLSHFKNLKPKIGFKMKLGMKNGLLVEIIREINRFIKYSPGHRYLMHDENIAPFYNVYNWSPIRKKTLGTRMDGLFLLLKQMDENLSGAPCQPKYNKPNRDSSRRTYYGAPDPLGGQLYGRWITDYRKNTRKNQLDKIVRPLSHKIIGFNKKRRYRDNEYEFQRQSAGAADIHADPMAFNLLDTATSFIASVTNCEEDGDLYKYLSQEVPETCLVYRQPHLMGRCICRSFVDRRCGRQHKLLPSYLVKSLKPDPFNTHDCWERPLQRFKYQIYVSRVSEKLLYHKMLKTADDLQEEDLCEDCHSSTVSSYGGDNEPKRRYTFEMAKQGAMYAYINATSLNGKTPTCLSVLFRLLLKRYLENDKIRQEWEKDQTFPCERKLSFKNQMRRLAAGFIKRWYLYPMEWNIYRFIKSLIVIRSGVLGNKDQPICHTPPPTDNEEEINFFIKYHFPPEQNRKRFRKTIKRIPDDLGKRNFRRLIELRKSFKDPMKVITRVERAEAVELLRKTNAYMRTQNEKEMLQKLKMLRWFFIKRRFKYYKRKQTGRIEWRTTPIYSIKKNSPFTHDEIVIMCVGTGNIHYIGKLTRKEILLLTESAEEYYKNGLLNIDKNKVYILGTVIPLIQAIVRLHTGAKMKVLNSITHGNAFRNRFDYLLHRSNNAMIKADLRDKNVDINCEQCPCYAKKVLKKGDYKSDPYTFIYYLSGQLSKVEHLAETAVQLTTLRHRVIKKFMFKMWEYKNLGRAFFPNLPTRDLAKLKRIPRSLLYNTNNTPYGIPHTAPISLYRIIQHAIEGSGIKEQCFRRLMHSSDLLMIVRRLQKYDRALNSVAFIKALCSQMVHKSVSYMVKHKNTFRKITKANKSIKEKRKIGLRAKRLKGVYTLLAQIVNWRLQGRLDNHPSYEQELLEHAERKTIMKYIYSFKETVKGEEDVVDDSRVYNEEHISPMMFYRDSIDTLQQSPNNFQATEDAIVRRYKTLISELNEIQQYMGPKTFAKKRKNKKRECYLVIRSMYKNLKVGKINSRRIAKSLKVWLRLDAHIRNLMNDFNDYIERVIDCKLNDWPPKEGPVRNLFLFEFEKSNTTPKPVMKLNECTYNKRLRVLINNKNKKILGGYRSLKLGTDWTSKYHEIIQRKFIKVEQFQQQKDSYVIQAGKMAAKGCEKVVKKCLYALSLFGFQKKDLELALLIYAKLRIMVKTEPKLRFPCKDNLLQEGGFLDSKYQIYTEVIEQYRQNISKFNPQFISWKRLDNNFMNKVLVENCTNPKLRIEKYFYGLDLRHTKNRKTLSKNELFDLHDYKYYDYKSDDDFSKKSDYSSDSFHDNKINVADCCDCEGNEDEESHLDENVGFKENRRISNQIDIKEFLRSDSNDVKDNITSIIHHHHMSNKESPSEFAKKKSIKSYSDLYINSNNFRRHSKKYVLKHIDLHKHDKRSYKIAVSSDNDSSSVSYDTKFRRSYFQDKKDMENRMPVIMESDMRIQNPRKEKRKKFSLRIKLGGELCWRKTTTKLKDTFEKFLNFKLSHLLFKCHDYRKHVVPEYHSIYYLRHLPVVKEQEDAPLLFTTVANFRKGVFERVYKKQFDPNKRRGTEDLDMVSLVSDSEQSLSINSVSEGSKEKLESSSVFDYKKSFLSKFNDEYQKLKGHDFFKLKEEVRNEIENFKQLLRYEKECLVQNAHSNDVLMEIAEKAEKCYDTAESLLMKRTFLHKRHINYKSGIYRFDPKEWQEYFDWINRNASFSHHHQVNKVEN